MWDRIRLFSSSQRPRFIQTLRYFTVTAWGRWNVIVKLEQTFRHGNCAPFSVNAPNLCDPSVLNCLPQYAEPIAKLSNCLFSYGQYFSFGTFWESRKPSRSSSGHLQNEMPASHTLRHVFMQDCGTWPSGRTLFNAGAVFQMTGSHFGWSWKWVDNWMEKGCKNHSVWPSGPHLFTPKSLFAIPIPEHWSSKK